MKDEKVLDLDRPEYYYNRELSWLKFNLRVLKEAAVKDTPLLERAKFIAIAASNLDEFFMVRVAGLWDSLERGSVRRDAAGMTAQEQLDAIAEAAHDQVKTQYKYFNSLRAEMEALDWSMMGHSLGGAMAAAFAGEHTDEIEGLILLGAYSTADLSSSDMKVLTIYGENDQVLNREKYEENRSNLPKKTTEYIIEGGNHAYFGAYGSQDGDGEATITQEEQMQQVVDLVLQW